MNFYLRTQVDPLLLMNPLRKRMRQFDPNVPVVGLQPLEEQIGYSLRTERLVARAFPQCSVDWPRCWQPSAFTA